MQNRQLLSYPHHDAKDNAPTSINCIRAGDFNACIFSLLSPKWLTKVHIMLCNFLNNKPFEKIALASNTLFFNLKLYFKIIFSSLVLVSYNNGTNISSTSYLFAHHPRSTKSFASFRETFQFFKLKNQCYLIKYG